MKDNKNFFDSSVMLYEAFKSNKPFMAGKIGCSELNCLYNYFKAKHINQDPISWYPNVIQETYVNTGVFPQTEQARIAFCDAMQEAVKHLDCAVAWSGSLSDFEKRFIAINNNKVEYIDLRSLESFYFGLPWTEHLKDKNVLVISPFTETIVHQYANRCKLWKDPRVLPEFNLLTLYHPPSKAISRDNRYISWIEMVNNLKDKMNDINYDVCIVGTGASSLPLCAHAKKKGKQAIHLGGPTQILFGIKGKRWDENNIINKFYNEHWVRPAANEIPEDNKFVEDGCYW